MPPERPFTPPWTGIATVVLLSLIIWAVQFLFDTGLTISKHKRLHKLTQFYFHGVVQNATSRPIRVTDYKTVRILQPGQNSLDRGIQDVDALVIDHPTEVDGVLYTSGVLKFCDFGILTVNESAEVYRLHFARRILFCKLFRDFHYYRDLPQAFERRDAAPSGE